MRQVLLEMRGITKLFPGVRALSEVCLKIKSDQIHALVGENGAGKSTLMNILSGVYPAGDYEGEIEFGGEICAFRGIKDSEGKGIVIIHQELALIPYLSIAENVFLGNERARGGVINWNETKEKTAALLKKVRLKDDPNTPVKDLGVGKQQLVEIAKALSKDVKLLILDEPTAALNEDDSQNLLRLLLELKSEGIASILISHKLSEVSAVADEITVLRDGAVIETLVKGTDSISEDRIIRGMVGRELVDRFPKRATEAGEICFEVKDWNVFDPLLQSRRVIKNVNLTLRRGEVVGLAGLMGAGRTELAMSIFGKAYGCGITGELWKDGRLLRLADVPQAIRAGLAYVTEDRKNAGLILIDNIMRNISLPNLKKLSKNTVIDKSKEIEACEQLKKELNIKAPGIFETTRNLSGGNQQKVVLGKWIFSEPDVLILDEPTRGIDVGAKYEIYTIINRLAEQGKSILLISSEMPELLGMCSRIYVMNEGAVVGELEQKNASQESIMRCIMQSGGGEA